MKLLLVNGSSNKDGNTAYALSKIEKIASDAGIEVEWFQIGKKAIKGCFACMACGKAQDKTCKTKEDHELVNELIAKMDAADGIVFGTPVKFAGMSSNLKALLERAFFAVTMNGGFLRHKVAASLAAVRRGGGTEALNQLNQFLAYNEFLQVHTNYWPVIHGFTKGEAAHDEEGNQMMEMLGENIVYAMQMKELAKDKITPPANRKKILTNFVRV